MIILVTNIGQKPSCDPNKASATGERIQFASWYFNNFLPILFLTHKIYAYTYMN